MAGACDFLPPFLLGSKHFLTLPLCLFHGLLLLLSFDLLLLLLFPLEGELLSSLLLCHLLLLLGSDLLPLGLLLLEPLEFLLFLGPLVSPLQDVVLQLSVQFGLFGRCIVCHGG